MPEWSNGPHSKCGVLLRVPWVRIPVSPLGANLMTFRVVNQSSTQTGHLVVQKQKSVVSR